MFINVLTKEQRLKQDNSNDSDFYSEPRFVYHLDESFRNRLTKLYKEKINNNAIVLDLMSSWTSHLPEEIKYKRVIGHGLNLLELENNKRLDSFWIQDFNVDQNIPLDDSSVDVCLMVAAWQYLQYPEKLAFNLKRVMKPKGQLIVSFSNRAFWAKAPRIWTEGSDIDHINYIKNVLKTQGWSNLQYITETTKKSGVMSFLDINGDPFFSVLAENLK